MKKSTNFLIRVKGPRACYTNSFISPERVSWPIPPPSSVTGIVKGIYWKPSIEYDVNRVIILNPIIYRTMKIKERKRDFSHDLKTISYLEDVDYIFDVTIRMTGKVLPEARSFNKVIPNVEDNILKHIVILETRLARGERYKDIVFGMNPYFVETAERVSDVDSFKPSCSINMEIYPFPVKMDYMDENKAKPTFGKATIKENIITYGY